jgi:hypothetical protein
VTDEMTVTTMQPLLGAPGLGDDGWRLVRSMTREPVAEARTVSIVPRRLDEDTARVRVTGLGERTAPVSLSKLDRPAGYSPTRKTLVLRIT